MTTNSARFALPFIESGQAQKEWTHNEALAIVDIVVQASVEAVGVDAPPASPKPGECWIVGSAPIAAWLDHAGAIAGWTAGGWRFVGPREGLAVWSRGDGTMVRHRSGAWKPDRGATVAPPSGGATIDAEARAAIGQILDLLRSQGWQA